MNEQDYEEDAFEKEMNLQLKNMKRFNEKLNKIEEERDKKEKIIFGAALANMDEIKVAPKKVLNPLDKIVMEIENYDDQYFVYLVSSTLDGAERFADRVKELRSSDLANKCVVLSLCKENLDKTIDVLRGNKYPERVYLDPDAKVYLSSDSIPEDEKNQLLPMLNSSPLQLAEFIKAWVGEGNNKSPAKKVIASINKVVTPKQSTFSKIKDWFSSWL